MNQATSIDEYINSFPEEIKILLEKMRVTIQQTAPVATEAISYGMPTFKLFGNLVHFAAFKNHIGLYPAPSGIKAFEKELSKYEPGKGTIRFPLNEPLPFPLIKKIVAFRVEENIRKNALKTKKPVK